MCWEVVQTAGRVNQVAVAEWDEVLSWSSLSEAPLLTPALFALTRDLDRQVWVESKLFQEASYAGYQRMCQEVKELTRQLSAEVGSAVSILGGSCKWDDPLEEIHKRLTSSQSMLSKLEEDVSTNTISDNVVTHGEMLELAQAEPDRPATRPS